MENTIEHLVSDQNGVYCYHVLAKNFPLYVQTGSGRWTELANYLSENSDVMGALYTVETVFNPDTPDYCENLEYLEHLGIFVRNDAGQYWHIESIEGTIWAVNPKAVWSEEEDNYILED